jgi:hypothetical protein
MTRMNAAQRVGMASLAVLSLVASVGCALVQSDAAAEATARNAYTHVVRGEDAALAALMEPDQRKPNLPTIFAKIRALVPPGPIPKPETINTTQNLGTAGATLVLIHSYAYPQQTITTTTTLVPAPEPRRWWIRGFYVNASLAEDTSATPHASGAPASSRP